MKKFLLFFTIILCFLVKSVSASEIYINSNGVKITTTEKKFITNFFGEDYLELITQEEFDQYKDYFQDSSKIQKNSIILRATDPKKALTITKVSQDSKTLISIKNIWNATPIVKSYDVIGARFEGVTLISTPVVRITNSNFADNITTIKKMNGFGSIIQLKNGNSIATIYQTFEVAGNGKVYGSYQHATSNVSLNDCKNFRIIANGLGNVFSFPNNNVYDNMYGVSISI